MYSRNLNPEAALEMIRKVRPHIEYVYLDCLLWVEQLTAKSRPNQGFSRQLEIFHDARFKISRRDKTTRMYYMERALEEVLSE